MRSRTAQFLPTRAQQIGVKPRVLAARTRRSMKSIRGKIKVLALPFDEIDQTVQLHLDTELLPAFDAFEQVLQETIDWLEEAADY